MNDMVVLNTPGQIQRWVFLSRIYQLALELNTDLKTSNVPILKAMHYEGWIDTPLRGTRKNKRLVLRAMVDTLHTADPTWSPSDAVTRALTEDE